MREFEVNITPIARRNRNITPHIPIAATSIDELVDPGLDARAGVQALDLEEAVVLAEHEVAGPGRVYGLAAGAELLGAELDVGGDVEVLAVAD